MSQKQSINIIWNLRAIPIEKVLVHYKVGLPESRGAKPYKVFCPFHGETNPSFTVYPDSNSFYCFSCSIGGDSINLIREKEQVRFLPALERLARIGGYELSGELVTEIAQSFGGVWGDPTKMREVFESRQREAWKKLTIEMSSEVQKLLKFPNWEPFVKNFEWIWDEYDELTLGQMTMKSFDRLKDWFKRSKRFIVQNRIVWVGLEELKREIYEERVGYLRDRRI